jgi:phosphoglycerate dehydrogenase-like enzyme
MTAESARRRGKIVLGYPAPAEHFTRLAAIAAEARLVRVATEAEACAEVEDASVFLGNRFFLQSLPFAKNLCWMQSSSAGVDVILADARARSHPFVLTAARGVYDEEMADHALALVYALLRDLAGAWRASREGGWYRRALPHLAGRTALVFGFGGVGRAVARRLVAARAKVVVVRRSGDTSDTEARALGVECIGLDAGLARLPAADVILLALPLTHETRGLFDARVLATLKSGAFLVNVARGDLIDESALEREADRLGGIGLDVFSEEPLPPGHWLRTHPHVLATPHVARSPDAPSPAYLPLFETNLAAFVAGRALLHVVDKERGY